MKKAQVSIDTFILLAALAFAALVIIAIVYPAVKSVLETEGEKGACEWSLVLHSIAKLGDWSLIPAECRAHRIEITLNDLEKLHSEAKKRITVYKQDQTKYKEIYTVFNNPEDPNQLNEWALNKIVATEMKDCWEKVFKGRLPLFDKWWTLYSWGSHQSPQDGKAAAKLWLDIGKFHQAPVNCIVCSRIKFSDDLKNKFGSRNEINSIELWLRYNYPSTGGRSYYDLLAEGQSELKGLFVSPYSYRIDSPLAVLYEKIYYYHNADVIITGIWDAVTGYENGDGEVNYLKLVPYTQEKIIGPLENDDGSYTKNEGCTFILD